MKKVLSLCMTVLLLISIVCVTPTVSAEEISYTVIDSMSTKAYYWEEICDERTIIKAGDWYYAYTGTMPSQVDLIAVCGYCGTETDVTIPTEFSGYKITSIRDFNFISSSVKTLRIPKEITSIDGWGEHSDFSMDKHQQYGTVYTPVFQGESELEEIIVDVENEKYSSMDGVLFTKNGVRLIYYPTHKADENYIVPDTVKYITRAAFKNVKTLKSLTITPNVTELGFDSIPEKGLEELRFANTHLPEENYSDTAGFSVKYLPDVPDTAIYCYKNSEIYKYYEKHLEDPIPMCKELKILSVGTETLVKEDDGKWYLYQDGHKIYKTTLVKHKEKWFYVKNGVWDKTVSDVLCWYRGKWFYIKNGKWDKTANGLMIISNDAWVKPEWTYIKNGKKYDKDKDLVKYKGKWFYVVDGYWYGLYTYVEWDEPSSINTLFKKNGKWFAIKSGKWYKGESIIKYSGKKFYVNKGFVQFGFSGKVKIDGKTYKIKNGKVV